MSAAFICPLCRGTSAEQVSHNLRAPMGERFAMRPHRCQECGLVRLHPYMSATELQPFYQGEFRRLYHGSEYDVESFHAARLPEAAERCRRLEEAGQLRGKLLEIGASTGAFLKMAARHGAQVEGVEPDDRQRAHAQGLGLEMVASLGEVSGGPFDLITLFHVLEHVLQPVEMLEELGARLAPGGALVCEVPNVDDALLSRHAIPEFDAFYWHPAHHLYFSPRTLAAAGQRAGLSVTVEPRQRYGLENHLHWAVHRRPAGSDEPMAAQFGFISAATRQAYAADLCRSFTCDTLWMVARRPR